jgi:hypothetical protein
MPRFTCPAKISTEVRNERDLTRNEYSKLRSYGTAVHDEQHRDSQKRETEYLSRTQAIHEEIVRNKRDAKRRRRPPDEARPSVPL